MKNTFFFSSFFATVRAIVMRQGKALIHLENRYVLARAYRSLIVGGNWKPKASGRCSKSIMD